MGQILIIYGFQPIYLLWINDSPLTLGQIKIDVENHDMGFLGKSSTTSGFSSKLSTAGLQPLSVGGGCLDQRSSDGGGPWRAMN